jgi:hypothetical protein
LVVISQAHKASELDSPTTSSVVRRIHGGIRRTFGTAQQGKAPALVADLKLMLQKVPNTRRPQGLGAASARFAGGFRRSELVALDVEDLEFSSAAAGGGDAKVQDRPRRPLAAHRHSIRLE